METAAVEDHIKYEAEEAENMTEHVWEEVEIEDENVAAWKQDLEMEAETEMSEELAAESTASESEEPAMEMTNPASEESATAEDIAEQQIDTDSQEVITGDVEETEYQLEQNGGDSQDTPAGKTVDAVEAIVVDPFAEDGTVPGDSATAGDVQTQASVATTMPIVTSVTSLANQAVQPTKMINLSNLKLLSKGGGYVNIGNKKVKLVPITGDRKLAMGGKLVRIANSAAGGNKNIVGKVFTLPRSPEKKLIPAKVVSVPSTANRTIAPAPTTVNIANQKVVPAKVVSVPNTKLRPIAPNPGNEVTIFITGIAGDKVTVKDSGQLLTTATRVPIKIAPQPTVRKVVQGVRYQSDQADASGSSDVSVSGEQVETVVVTPQLISDGHFLLQGSESNHGTTTTFACNVCDRQFTQLKYLLSHQQTHILPEPVSCDFCDKTFKRRYDLVRHKRRAHIDNTIYECDVCHKQFADRLVANRHRLTHTEEFKYCCEVCSRPFKYVHDLKRHRSIHFDEKPFECEICGKKFKHKSNLKTHQATHYSEKPYSCTLCDKRFHQKGNLKTHLIVHTGEMPFICTICSKRFHTRSGLLNHSYSHSDEKPFQCEICDKTFNWKSGLLTHQQTHRQRLMTNEEVQVIEIGPIPGESTEHITVMNPLTGETHIAV